MKVRRTTAAIMFLVLALVLTAVPAFAGGRGSGGATKAQIKTDAPVTSGEGDRDCTQGRTQDRIQDKLQDGSCDSECDGPATCDGAGGATASRSQARTQSRVRASESEETSGVATKTREMSRVRAMDQDSSDDIVVAPEPEEVLQSETAGEALGSVFQTMTRFVSRVFAWAGLA